MDRLYTAGDENDLSDNPWKMAQRKCEQVLEKQVEGEEKVKRAKQNTIRAAAVAQKLS